MRVSESKVHRLMISALSFLAVLFLVLYWLDNPPWNFVEVPGILTEYAPPVTTLEKRGKFDIWVTYPTTHSVRLVADNSTWKASLAPIPLLGCAVGTSVKVVVRIGRVYPRVIGVLYAICP
jgi:hypothetical protein